MMTNAMDNADGDIRDDPHMEPGDEGRTGADGKQLADGCRSMRAESDDRYFAGASSDCAVLVAAAAG